MAIWPVYDDEAVKELEQIEYVFGLTGGELEDEDWGGYALNYEGCPHYVSCDDLHTYYHTVIVTGGGFLPSAPEVIEEMDPYAGTDPDDPYADAYVLDWHLVDTYRSSGESDCPVCGAGADPRTFPDGFFEEYGRDPQPNDECGLCETQVADMPGVIYIGEGYEAVYAAHDPEADTDLEFEPPETL